MSGAFERLKKVPAWAWLASVAIFMVIFGFAADGGYPATAHPRPLQVAIVAAGVFLYLIPGWYLARRVEKRWGEAVGAATFLGWMGLAWAGADIAERLGY